MSETSGISLVRRMYWRIGNLLRTDVWAIRGRERNCGAPLSICYAGTEQNKNYFVDLAFSEERKVQNLGSKWIWEVERVARDTTTDCNAVVMETKGVHRKLLRSANSFVIPCWVRSTVSIPIKFANRSAKEDRRRINKYKLSYEITTDISFMRRFYEEMYLPTTIKQHGDKAFFADFSEIEQKAEAGNCQLMLVLDEGEAIAGQLIDLEETVPRLWSFGVLNGDAALWKKRVLPASVIFASEHLSQTGHETMSLGDSRAFLSDGVLQHKMKWGLELVKNSDRGYLLNLWRPASGLQGFLRSNPFLCIAQGDLYLVAFTTGEDADARNQLNSALEQASNLGVTRSRLYSFSTKVTENLQMGGNGTTVAVYPAAELFSDQSMNQPGKEA